MRLAPPLLLALFALVSATPVEASSRQFTIFEAPRELLGDDDRLRGETLDEIRSLGADSVRIVLYWKAVAPQADASTAPGFNESDPGAYPGLARYDRAIREARDRGLRVLLTVSGPVPKWATRSKRSYVASPNVARFGRFMTAVGSRYRDQVDLWSIWNEPNHPKYLLPQFARGKGAVSPELYRKLFQAGETALDRSGNARDRVLLGETAPRGTSTTVAPLRFLRETLCLSSRYRKRGSCSRLDAGGYAHHAYTTRNGPFFRPGRRDDVTIGVLSRLSSAIRRAERAGALPARTGIYLTEFGIQSKPDPFVGVSQATQAAYRSISERIAYLNPRVRAFSQYLMRDDAPREGVAAAARYSGFESGLRTHSGRAKRSYEGFRLPLVATRSGGRAKLWGLVRPASGRTLLAVDYTDTSGRTWHRLRRQRTGKRGYWSASAPYRRGRAYRVKWTAPGGQPVFGPLTRVHAR